MRRTLDSPPKLEILQRHAFAPRPATMLCRVQAGHAFAQLHEQIRAAAGLLAGPAGLAELFEEEVETPARNLDHPFGVPALAGMACYLVATLEVHLERQNINPGDLQAEAC